MSKNQQFILLHRLPFEKQVKIEGIYNTMKEALNAKLSFLCSFQSKQEWIDIATYNNGELILSDFTKSMLTLDALNINIGDFMDTVIALHEAEKKNAFSKK